MIKVISSAINQSRPIRRRLSPWSFKESYVNAALDRRSWARTYLEIGVRDGECLRLARADRKVGIDPARTSKMMTLVAGEEFFEKTSDAFFLEDAASVLAPRSVDVALIDGLHEFRHALRDLLNLERYMRTDGVIIFDDCNPETSERAIDSSTGKAWNGDVWKVAPFVLSERTDLIWHTIAADEGVGVVTGFGADHAWPTSDTVEQYKQLPYERLASDRRNVLRLVPRSQFIALLP